MLQVLCIHNNCCVSTAPVTAAVYPQHLLCIYSTCYRYCVSTTLVVYLQHLLQILCIHNNYCVSTAPVTAAVYPQHLLCIYSTCYRYCVSTITIVCLQLLLHLLCICRFTVTIFPPSGKYWHLFTFLEKINIQIKSQSLTLSTVIELSVKITDYTVYVSSVRISRHCEPFARMVWHSFFP